MKNFFLILITVVLLRCNNQTDKPNNSIIGMTFQNYKQINQLKDYTKISDTIIDEKNIDPKYGIIHLRDDTNNLVVFSDISLDSNDNRSYEILDTLIIPNTNKSEFVTIGYCQIHEDDDQNLIAVVDKTDSITVQNIKKVWKANTVSKKIEFINNLTGINCINEWFVQL